MSSAMVGNGYPPNYNTYNSQPSPSHGQNLITTGVLSYSDERHQQLQDMLGSQRQKEYNQYLQKQEGYYDPHPSSRPPANEQQHYRSSPSQPHSVQTTPRRGVFYRLVSPDGGLPLGQYEEQRKYLDEQRQRDYLKMMSQKEKQEYQKREEEKVQKQVRDQKAQMQKQEQEKKLYNYNKVQKQFQEERRKDYEEFVPMGGIPRRGKYFPALESLTLAEKKYREYLRNQQTDEESDSSAELDINDHSNRRKSRRSKDSDSEEDKPRTPLPWDSTLFEGKHTDEFLARGGIPRRRKQKYTRKSGRAKERQNEYMAFLQSKLQEIQNQIKLQMEKSGEEREITTEKHEKNEEIQYTQSNRTKKLSKRQNEAPRKLLVYQRGLQTPPWAEHYEVEDITTTEKIGHEGGKGKDLSNGKGLDEQPWYQNHQKSLKVPLLEKESNRNGKETYEPSILGQSDQVPSRHSNTGNAGAGRDRQDDNQTDEAKLNKYEERNTQGNDYGYNQKLSNSAQKGQQNGSFSGNERHHHSSHIEGQRINTQNSENHLWNNTRKLEYDKNFPGKKQSQDLLSEDLESWTSHQGRYGEGHRRQQGDQSRGGHVDKGQGVEGQHARKLETRHNTGQMAESQYHRNKEERRLSRGQKVEDQQSIHQNESRHGQSLTRNSQSPDDQHNDLRANGIDQQQKKYESPSGRGHWDKSHWDEGQLSKGQQEIGQNNENPKGNQKEDTEGKTFDDFMPFGGMLRRRKIDPAVLKAEFLKETQKNLNEWTLKMKEEQAKYKQPPTPPGGLNVGHYELYRKRLKEDLVNEYQAWLKQQQKEKIQLQLAKAQQEYSSNLAMKPPASPLPVKQVDLFDPEKTRQVLRDDRHKDYNDFLLEKEKNPSPRRAPTPPNGLDIVTQDERTRMAREKQRQYGQELQRQTQEQMLQKIHNNIPVIDRTGQQPAGPNQYNHFPPQQHMMAPPPQYRASPPPSNVPSHPPHQSMSPPPQHSQQHQMQGSHRNHNHGTPAGSQSPPPRHRSHATPQRTEHGGYFPEFNGKQQSPLESRDGHRPPPHPRRYATPDRPDWARGPQRQNGTPTARSSHRRDDRQTPSYWNAGVPVKSPATTPSTRAPSTQQSNRTLTPKDSQDMIPDLHLESFRKDPMLDRRKEERNREYNKFLDEEHNREQQRREKLENLRKQPAVQPKYDNYSNSDNHERHRHNLESERRGEYQSFLSKNGEPVYPYARNPSSDLALSRLSGGLVGGIFGDVQHETDRRRAMINQRNKEYNELKKQSKTKEPSHRTPAEFGLPLDNEMSNEIRRQQEKIRNREYRNMLEKQNQSSREPSQEVFRRAPEFGLPLDNRKSNELRRQQEKDRNQDYRKFLEGQKQSPRRYHPPTPEEKQGLPLTQKPYDDKKAVNEKQRNMEYNQYLAKSGLPYDKMSLKGSAQQSSRQANGHHSGMEPRPPMKRHPSKKHDREVAQRLEEEKNHTKYWNMLNELPQKTVRHIPSGGSRKEVDFENQKAFPMGNDYAEKQKKLREEWRKSYEIQMEKVGHSTYKKKSYTPQVQIQISKEEGARSQRDDSFRQSWERSMETPPIVPAGIYDQKRLQINAKMQADYQVYLASQQPVNRSKEFWGTNDNPRIYPTSGEYKKRGEKMKEELREEFHSFMDKQEPPKERKKVFGDQGSVLFVSKYPDTKKHMNAERRKEMIDYLEKKKGEVPRRQGDPSVDEKNMFSDMGKAQEAHSRRMQENARQDYKNYVDHAFPEGLNRGQPSFAAGKQPPDSWYSAQPPTHRYSPPRDFGPEQNGQKSNDPYTERLQQARANEAMYRRHDHEMNGQSQRAPPPRQEAPYALH